MGKFLTNAGENPIGLHRMWTGPALNCFQLEKWNEIGKFHFLFVINSTCWSQSLASQCFSTSEVAVQQKASLPSILLKQHLPVLYTAEGFQHKMQMSGVNQSQPLGALPECSCIPALHTVQLPFSISCGEHTSYHFPYRKKKAARFNCWWKHCHTFHWPSLKPLLI